MSYNKLSNYATNIVAEGGWMKVYYHSTCIVKWNNEQIILNSNGWQTKTTKQKMNQASYQFKLGYTVYQEDFKWYVTLKNDTLEFNDGMIIKR